MRRWLAILLLLFMPVQGLWAAAAPYCQHEEDPAAMHVGHHTHEHHGAQSGLADLDDDGGGPAAEHADCHTCHGGAASIATSSQVAAPGLARESAPESAAALPAAPVTLPERPDWARSA